MAGIKFLSYRMWCFALRRRAAPHVDTFTPDALSYVLHCTAVPCIRFPCSAKLKNEKWSYSYEVVAAT